MSHTDSDIRKRQGPMKSAPIEPTTEVREVPLPRLPLDEVRQCACGANVRLKLPVGAPKWLQRVAAHQLAGFHPVECKSCVEKADRVANDDREREFAERRLARRMHSSGIPLKWRETSFDGLERDARRVDAIKAAEQWGAGTRRGLLLHGNVGRGKSAIAAAAAMARVQHGSVRWLSVAELLLKLRMPFSSPEYARAVRALEATDRRVALVLDDLDKLKPTDVSVQPLYIAINAWVEAKQPLLVTLNRSLEELGEDFGERFGEAIASRLAEHCLVVEVGGRDRRVEP